MTDERKKFRVVTYYETEDATCSSDYLGVEIIDASGNLIISYGDAYHARGREQSAGFIQGLKYAFGDIEVIYEQIADSHGLI